MVRVLLMTCESCQKANEEGIPGSRHPECSSRPCDCFEETCDAAAGLDRLLFPEDYDD